MGRGAVRGGNHVVIGNRLFSPRAAPTAKIYAAALGNDRVVQKYKNIIEKIILNSYSLGNTSGSLPNPCVT